MKIDRNLSIQNQYPVNNVQSQKGKIGDSSVKLGDAKPKSGSAINTFFSNIKQAITSRGAKIADFFRSLTPNGRVAVYNAALKKATPEEIRNGHLNNMAPPSIKGQKPPENPQGEMRKEFVKLVINKDQKLDAHRIGNAQVELRALVEPNLENNTSPGTILRGNTPDTKYQVALFKAVGGEYTASILNPILKELAEAGNLEVDPKQIDIDPNSLKGGETVESKAKEIATANCQKLGQIYDKLMNTLSNSVESMPQEMKDTCALTYALIKRAGGDDQTARNGASATIILRLLNPALTAPEFNAPDKGSLGKFENSDHKRGALLLSKMFQNQANSVLGFDKDQTLAPLTDKLTENNDKLQKFLNSVISNGNVDRDLEAYLPKDQLLDQAQEQFTRFNDDHLQRELELAMQGIDDPIDEEIVLSKPREGPVNTPQHQTISNTIDLDKELEQLSNDLGDGFDLSPPNEVSNKNLVQVDELLRQLEKSTN